MAGGKIIEHKEKGLYSVEIIKDEERIKKRKEGLLSRQKGALAEQEKLSDKLNDLYLKLERINKEIELININIEGALDLLSQKSKERKLMMIDVIRSTDKKREWDIKVKSLEMALQLIDERDLVREVVDAQSVEFYEYINVGKEVALIESANETQKGAKYLIERNDAEHVYSKEKFGIEVPVSVMNPYEFFIEKCKLPGDLVKKPRYWHGIVNGMANTGETCNVLLDKSKHEFVVDIFPDNKQQLIDIKKLEGNFSALEVGKFCCVTFEKGLDDPRVLYVDAEIGEYSEAFIGNLVRVSSSGGVLNLSIMNFMEVPLYTNETTITPLIFFPANNEIQSISTDINAQENWYKVFREGNNLTINYFSKADFPFESQAGGANPTGTYSLDANALLQSLKYIEYGTGSLVGDLEFGKFYSIDSKIFNRHGIYDLDKQEPLVAFYLEKKSLGSPIVNYMKNGFEDYLEAISEQPGKEVYANGYLIRVVTQSQMNEMTANENG